MHGVVYKIIDTENGFLYIGQSTNFRTRKSQHLSDVKYRQGLSKHKALKRYRFKIIYLALTKNSLDNAENCLIQHHGRKKNLYNLRHANCCFGFLTTIKILLAFYMLKPFSKTINWLSL